MRHLEVYRKSRLPREHDDHLLQLLQNNLAVEQQVDGRVFVLADVEQSLLVERDDLHGALLQTLAQQLLLNLVEEREVLLQIQSQEVLLVRLSFAVDKQRLEVSGHALVQILLGVVQAHQLVEVFDDVLDLASVRIQRQ